MTNATGYSATVDEVSGSAAVDIFDNVVHREMDMTGVEFLRRYDRGDYDLDPDSVVGLPAVLTVLPFAR